MAHVASEHSAPHGYTGFFTKSQLKKIADVHRKWEFEADMEALVTLKNAGYNGNAAAALLERFESDDVKVTVDYHRRHPSIQARVQLLRSTVSDPKADRFAWSR